MREAGSIDARPSHPSPACISVHSFHHDDDDGDDDDGGCGGDDDADHDSDHNYDYGYDILGYDGGF